MKKPILIFLLAFAIHALQAQTINTEWAIAVGGSSTDAGNSIAVDASGNVFNTGTFQGTVITPLGTFVSAGGNDVYVAAFASAGNLLWGLQIGGIGADASSSIAADAAGNVYVAGSFTGTVDFDPGPAGPLTASGGATDADIFVAKFNGITGSLIWVKQMGGAGPDEALGIAVDATNNVYTTGFFSGTANFDPNGSTTLTSAGDADVFVSKLDATGSYGWAVQMGGGTRDFGTAINIDATGNVLSTGVFTGTVDFDPSGSTLNFSASGNDTYVSKLSGLTGTLVWAAQIGGTSDEQANGIVTDAAGNVYLTGFFDGMTDFNPDPTPVTGDFILTTNGGRDIFISKLSSVGGFLWAKNVGNPANGGDSDRDIGRSIALDAASNVYTVGSFANTADFNPDPALGAVTNLTSVGERDVFLSVLNSSGDFVLARQFGATSFDQAESIAINSVTGNLHITGWFAGSADFDLGPGTLIISSNSGSQDIVIVKLSQLIVTPVTLTRFTAKLIDQSVQLQWITESEINTSHFEIEKSADGLLFNRTGTVRASGHSSLPKNYSFVDQQPSGKRNYYRLKMIDADGSFAYSKIVAITLNVASGLQVFPNPVKDAAYVQITGNDPGSLFTITDATGKVIRKQKLVLNGTTVMTIPMSALPKGIYYFTLTTGSKTQQQKLIKQ